MEVDFFLQRIMKEIKRGTRLVNQGDLDLYTLLSLKVGVKVLLDLTEVERLPYNSLGVLI